VWVELEGVKVLVVRITYVGELGFELHVPWDECGKVLASLESQVPGGKLNCAGMEVKTCGMVMMIICICII